MTTAITRLHICPFSPDLLPVIIPTSISSAARNISYHCIQTFPENNYGYLDLPAMEAEKIKKKLNGSILKGKKIKVEEAKPQKRRRTEEEVEKVTERPAATVESSAPKAKKAKKDPAVIPGHKLSPERKVKRGWTEVKSDKSKRFQKNKRDRASSKYSEQEELLFRTRVPPNKIEKKIKDGKKEKKKRGDDRIVHEFEKSTSQPSFLRNEIRDDSKQATSYVDGKGWVGTDGQIVEQEHGRTLRQRRLDQKAARVTNQATRKEVVIPDKSDSASESDSEEEPDEATRPAHIETPVKGRAESTEDTFSSSTSDFKCSSEAETSPAKLNSSPRTMLISTEAPLKEVTQTDVHPLEALFKKPGNPASQDIAKPSLEVQTTFSFFDANKKDDVEDEPVIPLTPFSSQDLRARDHRSAAPTPDTAYPSRFNSYGSTMSEKLSAEEESGGVQDIKSRERRTSSALQEAEREPSDFEKKFWERRGDNNRAWKQRRRETLKEKRQKENRAKKGRRW